MGRVGPVNFSFLIIENLPGQKDRARHFPFPWFQAIFDHIKNNGHRCVDKMAFRPIEKKSDLLDLLPDFRGKLDAERFHGFHKIIMMAGEGGAGRRLRRRKTPSACVREGGGAQGAAHPD